MAKVRFDMVAESSTTTGTGNITLGGAKTPGRTFSTAGVATSDTFKYRISHDTLNEWEVGTGTLLTSTTFSRAVIASSNANALVNFSAGNKTVELVVDKADLDAMEVAASTSVAGHVVLNTTTEVVTGTDVAKACTADSVAALWEKGTDNTGGATITLGDGGMFDLITSTTAITAFAFSNDRAGRTAKLRFLTSRVLTHNSTSLILPFGGANITTEVGDTCEVTSLGSGNFFLSNYERADGRNVRGMADPNVYDLYDDFEGSVVATPIYPWTETNSATATNTRPVSAGHIGVLGLTTGAVSGNNKRLHLGVGVADAILTPNQLQRFSWVVRIPTITTVLVRLGVMQDVSAAAGGTAGAYFEFDPTVSANWRYVTRQASTSTANNALAVTAGNWYVLEARRLGNGNWEFWANNVLRFTHSSNLPTTNCNFGVFISTVTAAARSVDLDMAGLRSLTQRFT